MNPIICDLPAFDKNKGTVGKFITSGQIYQHEVIIKDNKTGEELYSFLSEPNNRLNRFEIPAFQDNTIKNGCCYQLFIKVWENQNDNKSYTSAPKIIKCASTPDFQLDITPAENTGYTLNSATLKVGVNYVPESRDAEIEQLNEYYITVKQNSDGKEIYKSRLMYNVNEQVEINDLENQEAYTVAAHGKTINGMEIKTNDVTVNIDYEPCEDTSVLTAKNDAENACILLNSSITNILYKTKKPPIYTPSVDLTDNTLEYYKGFNIASDFSMYIKYYPKSPDNEIINLNNNHIKVNFKTRKNYRLPLTAGNIASDGNSVFNFNNDGTMTMTITKQYGGIWFNLPANISGAHNFTKVTVKYKDGSGNFGYACRYAGETADSSPDTIWNNLLNGSDTFEKTFNPEKKLTRFKFFCTSDNLSETNTASVTITSVTFTESSYSLYQPYFELYTGNKMVIIDKNESGQPLKHIDTKTYSFSSYCYELKLLRNKNKIDLKINDWRR